MPLQTENVPGERGKLNANKTISSKVQTVLIFFFLIRAQVYFKSVFYLTEIKKN